MSKNNYVDNDNWEDNLTEYDKITSLIGDELFTGVDYEELWQSVSISGSTEELVVALNAKDWLDELVIAHSVR